MNPRVAQYKYELARETAARIGYAHIAFFFILLLYMPQDGWMVQGRTIYCIISALLVSFLQYILDMSKVSNVVTVMLAYFSIIVFEWITLGIPRQLISIDPGLSKGVMFEILITMIPLVYIVLRIALVMLFIPLFKWSRRLESIKG